MRPHAKLTAAAVQAIREDGRPARVVAAEYGVSRQTVYEIRRGHTWKRAPGPIRHRPRVPASVLESIRADKRLRRLIAAEHGVSISTVDRARAARVA